MRNAGKIRLMKCVTDVIQQNKRLIKRIGRSEDAGASDGRPVHGDGS